MSIKISVILLISLGLLSVNSWIVAEELAYDAATWEDYEMRKFLLYPDFNDLTSYQYVTENYKCEVADSPGLDWGARMLGGPASYLSENSQLQFTKTLEDHTHLQITAKVVLFGYNYDNTNSQTLSIYAPLPDNTYLTNTWSDEEGWVGQTFDGTDVIVDNFCNTGLQARRYDLLLKGDSQSLRTLNLIGKTYGGTNSDFRWGIYDLKICATNNGDDADYCVSDQGLPTCDSDQSLYNNTCQTSEFITTCINSLIPLRSFNGEYQYQPQLEYDHEQSKIVHKYFIKSYDHSEACSEYEIYINTLSINNSDNLLEFVAASGDVGAHIYFETSLEFINHTLFSEATAQVTFTITIQVISDFQIQYQEFHDVVFNQSILGDDIISNLHLDVSIDPVTVNDIENSLGIESTLRICADGDCNIVSSPSNPFQVDKDSEITLRQTITTAPYKDDYYLGLESVKIGPYPMPSTSYVANQGYVDITFKVSVAGGALEYTIYSVLQTPPSDRRRNLSQNNNNSDFEIGSKIVLEVVEGDKNNNDKLTQDDEAQETKVIKINSGGSDNKGTVLMIVLGVAVGIFVILIVGCIYGLRNQTTKKNSSGNTNNTNNNNKIGKQDYEQAVKQTDTEQNEKYLISTIRSKDGLNSMRSYRINNNNIMNTNTSLKQ